MLTLAHFRETARAGLECRASRAVLWLGVLAACAANPAAVLAQLPGDGPWLVIAPDHKSLWQGWGVEPSEVRVLREDLELDVRALRWESSDEERGSQTPARLSAAPDRHAKHLPAGAWLVSKQHVERFASSRDDEGEATSVHIACPEGWRPPAGKETDFAWLLEKHVPLLTAAAAGKEPETPTEPLTFDALYGEDHADLGGSPARIIRWLADGDAYLMEIDGEICRVEAASGRRGALADTKQLAETLEQLPEIDQEQAESLARRALRQLDAKAQRAWLVHRSDVYTVMLDGSAASRLTHAPGEEELVEFSPDGQLLAFVRAHDLFTIEVESGREQQLTTDGSALVRNGKADWVYFEEVNRRDWKAFHWSPDSTWIAFQRTDDSPVSSFTVTNHLQPQQELEVERYPKAGQPNPRVQLGIVPARGGPVRWFDLAGYSPDQIILAGFGWSQKENVLYVFVQDRTQTWLDFWTWNVDRNAPARRWFRQETEAWVDPPLSPQFLEDGSCVTSSEEDGWRHLYHYEADGTLRTRLTSGSWEVRQIHGLSADGKSVYFSATRDSPLAENLYRVQLDGKQLTRLTPSDGNHQVNLAPGGRYFADRYSSFRSPPQVLLRDGDGECVRTIDNNPVVDLARYTMPELRPVEISARDGVTLPAVLVLPPGHRQDRRYPLWIMTYGGPQSPMVRDDWSSGRAFARLLATSGILVIECDPRSATGRGGKNSWTAYRQLGVQETADLEDVVRWAVDQGLADPDRVGLSGHSYGGYLTAYAMTQSNRFTAGIAGAPVTDWRNYDTIYTERYMGLPQDNAEGYRRSSVVEAAEKLHGRLLIAHGARDDNVHVANTYQLAHALQQAEKQFEMMIYPDSRHGIPGNHYRRLMFDFICRAMRVDPAGE